MRVLADENTERRVVEYLSAEGHDAVHAVDVFGPSEPDPDIAAWARERDHLVLTKDPDFLRMADDEHAGVLFITDGQLSAYRIATIVLELLEQYDRDDLHGVAYVTEEWL